MAITFNDPRSLAERLPAVLREQSSDDGYILSPAYHLTTGRRGLAVVDTPEGLSIVSRHPNRGHAFLVFDAFDGGTSDPAALLARLNVSEAEAMRGRVPNERSEQATPLHEERVLDWRYPVHTLDAAVVRDMAGRLFRDFRLNVNRASTAGLSWRPARFDLDAPFLRSMARRWGADRASSDFTARDIAAPALHALSLVDRLPIGGVVIERSGDAIGFGLWEETRPEAGLANGLVNIAAKPVRGVSEFTHFAMCARLAELGFAHLCIGGSESADLDAFKKKMRPCRSLQLWSAPVSNNASPSDAPPLKRDAA